MKNKLIAFIAICLLSFSFTGCAPTPSYYINENAYKANYFTLVKEWRDTPYNYKIVCANDTKVLYLIVMDGYHYGITPLYNADGTLQVYQGYYYE